MHVEHKLNSNVPPSLFPIPSTESRYSVLISFQRDHCMYKPRRMCIPLFFIFYLILFFFICGGFCHTLKWNSHGLTCVPHPDPPSHLPLHPLPLGFPVHQVRALVSCIQPGLVICFTLDNIHVSMLFSWNIPPSPSPTESKRLFYKSVSFFFFLFCI